MDKTYEIDRLDRNILGMVQLNNQTPHREIANQVGLSTPAVTRRLKRLREIGVIRGDVSLLDGKALNRALTLVVLVKADREQITELDAMRVSFEECPQVQHCYYVTGDADFILIFNIGDMTEYETLTRKLFIECTNILHFTTYVSMETIKACSRVIV